MSEDKRPTVQDIEWHMRPNFDYGYVYAEDQYLFFAGEYGEQVCQEHNEVGALRKALHNLVLVSSVVDGDGDYICCAGTAPEHMDDCPVLIARQLLESEGSR